jgi:ArsR family transcriptional regulator
MSDWTQTDLDLSRLAHALGAPPRVRIVRMLVRRGPLVAGEIAKELPLAPSTVSEHLRVLREAGLIHGAREGQHVRYEADLSALRKLTSLLGGLTISAGGAR